MLHVQIQCSWSHSWSAGPRVYSLLEMAHLLPEGQFGNIQVAFLFTELSSFHCTWAFCWTSALVFGLITSFSITTVWLLTSFRLVRVVTRGHHWDAPCLQSLPPTLHHLFGLVLKDTHTHTTDVPYSETIYFTCVDVDTNPQCLRHRTPTAPWNQWSLGAVWPVDTHPANMMHYTLAWQYSEHRRHKEKVYTQFSYCFGNHENNNQAGWYKTGSAGGKWSWKWVKLQP